MISELTEELYFVHEDFATVQLSLCINDDFVVAEGKARRDPHDKPCTKTAELLAYGRALQRLAEKVMRRADGMIKHNDDMQDRHLQLKQAKANKAIAATLAADGHKYDLAIGEQCPACTYVMPSY